MDLLLDELPSTDDLELGIEFIADSPVVALLKRARARYEAGASDSAYVLTIGEHYCCAVGALCDDTSLNSSAWHHWWSSAEAVVKQAWMALNHAAIRVDSRCALTNWRYGPIERLNQGRNCESYVKKTAWAERQTQVLECYDIAIAELS